ncbi:MarR family winged helix-turn-helix transcriptional regulator [Ensifer aridi]|uniref:MarR family winged helix-turn-helix transcriptional regulator n=1 Tax=Ensifer aridi TaxID=1708715 RepID=UPI000A10E420|nr:MarR family winged helix-turn-helix transcriptional regulator [Ensifer aridi]
MNTTTISPAADNKTARRLLSFIEEFRKLNPNIQAGQIAVFLHIMAKPGITMKELEKATGLSSTAVSRNVLALSEWYKADVPGYDLVETFDDPHDRRNKRVRAKQKGQRVYNSLIQILGS